MGASPKYKLSPEGKVALDSINGASKEPWLGYREFLDGFFKATKREKEGTLIAMLQLGPPLPFVLVFGKDPSKGHWAEWQPQFLYRKEPRIVDRVPVAQEEDQAEYFLAGLLCDLWRKGPDRLKRCAWKSCERLFWDPTNTKVKRYCEGIHDSDRMKARELKSRRNNSRRKSPTR